MGVKNVLINIWAEAGEKEQKSIKRMSRVYRIKTDAKQQATDGVVSRKVLGCCFSVSCLRKWVLVFVVIDRRVIETVTPNPRPYA